MNVIVLDKKQVFVIGLLCRFFLFYTLGKRYEVVPSGEKFWFVKIDKLTGKTWIGTPMGWDKMESIKHIEKSRNPYMDLVKKHGLSEDLHFLCFHTHRSPSLIFISPPIRY